MDLSKVEAGKLDIHVEDISMHDIAQSVENVFLPIASKTNVDFVIDIANDVPRKIHTDKKRVDQILRNLLSNAFKFTEKGSVTLKVTKYDGALDSKQKNLYRDNILSIAVIDTGIGIPNDKQQAVFEAFQQIDGSISRKHSGTGLGLAITRQLVNMLGGEITIESQENVGTTFTAYLPIVQEDQVADPVEDIQPDVKIEKNIVVKHDNKLLIIEDDPNNKYAITKLFANDKIIIDEAIDGKMALTKLRENQYNCVILDLNLPDISGIEILEMINRNPSEFHATPTVVYTGEDLSKNQYEKIREHANSVVLKVNNSKERLRHEVLTILDSKSNQANSSFDDLLGDKNILLVDDDMRNLYALSAVLKANGMRTAMATNGLKALDKLKSDNAFDMILMDIMMPEMNGYEAMEAIRNQLQLVDIPIIAVTAKAMKGDDEKCYSAGANDYLVKPIDTEKLLSMMKMHLSKR